MRVKPEPLTSHIIAIREEKKEKSEGGIVLPTHAMGDSYFAMVVEVGPDCIRINRGDRILLPIGGGTTVDISGQKVVILLEEEVQVRLNIVED